MITVLRHSFLQKPPEGSKGHLVSLFAACQALFPSFSLQPREVLKVGLLWPPLTVIVLRKVVVAALLVGLVQFHVRNGVAFFCQSRFSCILNGGLLAEIAMCLCNLYRIHVSLCLLDIGLKK